MRVSNVPTVKDGTSNLNISASFGVLDFAWRRVLGPFGTFDVDRFIDSVAYVHERLRGGIKHKTIRYNSEYTKKVRK